MSEDVQDYTARIITVLRRGVVSEVRLLLTHRNGNTWHDFSPQQYPELTDCYAKALELAGNFGVRRMEVQYLEMTESSVFPDDFS